MAIHCRQCEREIRSNAAEEEWDDVRQVMVYRCRRCAALNAKVEKLMTLDRGV